MAIPLRLVPFTGVYGLSFVFMMMSTALALAVLQRPRRELLWLALLPLLVLLPAMPAAVAGHDTALLVQPNISETEDWTEQSVDRMQREQVALTARGALTGTEPTPSIVVWPEVPAPLYYYEDSRFPELRGHLGTHHPRPHVDRDSGPQVRRRAAELRGSGHPKECSISRYDR